ncbi:MAG: endonuclease/exonuclease/phosphatase family protein [Hormoscilla sp.]
MPLFISSHQGNHSGLLPSVTGAPLQIVHANLDRNNRNLDRAIAYLRRQKADIIFLQEVTPQWLTEIESHLSGYRVLISQPLKNTHGVAMLVPLKLKNIEIINTEIIHLPPGSDRPMIAAIIRYSEKEIALLSLHTIRPRSRGTSAYQQREFSAAALWSQTQLQPGREVIAIGDFNSTPWSGRFRQFLQQSNLINSLQGYGLQPSWLAGFPAILMIPIDHCLHSRSLLTQQRLIGENIGSDHLALSIKLALIREL